MSKQVRSIAVTVGVVLGGGILVSSALASIGGNPTLPVPPSVSSTVAPPALERLSNPAADSASSTTSLAAPVEASALSVPDGGLSTTGLSDAPPSGSVGGGVAGDDDGDFEGHDGDGDHHDGDHEGGDHHDGDHHDDHDGDHEDGDDD